MNWLQAEIQAVKWGGHLVTINDREEELWLREQFGEREYFWIGFNDIVVEGNVEEKNEENWEWVSGEPVTYINWAPEEPNNRAGVDESEEDAAIINWGGPGQIYGEGWNDIRVRDHHRGIVERLGTVGSPAAEQ
jgi:hypothetical protein